METSQGSNLPEWPKGVRFYVDTADGSFDLYEVVCQRADCKFKFWVPKTFFVVEEGDLERFDFRGYKTRPCPRCFKAAWLPGQNPDRRKSVGDINPPARRVVKRKKSAKR